MVLMPILTPYIYFHLNPAKYTPFSRLESFISIYHRAGRGRDKGALSCIHLQPRVLTVDAAITAMTAVYRQYPWGICSRVLTGFPLPELLRSISRPGYIFLASSAYWEISPRKRQLRGRFIRGWGGRAFTIHASMHTPAATIGHNLRNIDFEPDRTY
jgi:hypothetical protein